MTRNNWVLVRIWLIAITGLGMGAFATSCSSPAPVEGTNTNWLKCVKDADCASLRIPASCSGGYCVATDGGARIVTLASTLPACSWPLEFGLFDGDASARATCLAARAYLTCGPPGGGGEMCLSDNATSCPNPQVSDPRPCTDQCNANEYAAWCGGVGPGPVPDPPAGCRSVGAIPAGIAYYCCPCGS